MSDERLRQLERAWRASGTAEDEAAWLSARERAGDLTRETLERAARMNHVPARLALGLPILPRELPLTDVLGDSLDPIPGDPCVRCWAGELLDPWPTRDPSAGDDPTVFITRCSSCGAQVPEAGNAVGHRREPNEEEREDGIVEVTYERGLPSFEQLARDRAEETMWREAREEDEATRRRGGRPEGPALPPPTLAERVWARLFGWRRPPW